VVVRGSGTGTEVLHAAMHDETRTTDRRGGRGICLRTEEEVDDEVIEVTAMGGLVEDLVEIARRAQLPLRRRRNQPQT
jgi:hypothetical protein